MLLRGAVRTDEGPYGHREATGNAGDSPANGTKTGRRKRRGKKEEEREGPPDGRHQPDGYLQTRVRQKPIRKKGLQLSLQAFEFPGAEGQN